MITRADPTHKVTLIDVCVLLHNMLEGINVSTVGFEDIEHNVWEMRRKLNRTIDVPEGIMTSALWSCNLMNEQKLFWHYNGQPFSSFVKDITPAGHRFNPKYNLFEKVESKK